MKKYHLQNRPNREITSNEEIEAILKNGKFTTISMCRNNEPYIVTLSYGYDSKQKALYFHTSDKGLKLEFLQENKYVCATVIEDKGYIMDECAHEYRSVVFRGEMYVVTDMEDRRYGMKVLLEHLEEKQSVVKEKLLKSEDFYSKMAVLRLDIKQIQGKAGR